MNKDFASNKLQTEACCAHDEQMSISGELNEENGPKKSALAECGDVASAASAVESASAPFGRHVDDHLVNEANRALNGARLNFHPLSSAHDLLPVPQEIRIYLFGALSSKYLREVSKFVDLIR